MMSTPQRAANLDYYQEFGFKRKESTTQRRQDVEQFIVLATDSVLSAAKMVKEASDSLNLLA